jgi:hypothetical protein
MLFLPYVCPFPMLAQPFLPRAPPRRYRPMHATWLVSIYCGSCRGKTGGCYFHGEIEQNDNEQPQPNSDELLKYVDISCPECSSNTDTRICAIDLDEVFESEIHVAIRFLDGTIVNVPVRGDHPIEDDLWNSTFQYMGWSWYENDIVFCQQDRLLHPNDVIDLGGSIQAIKREAIACKDPMLLPCVYPTQCHLHKRYTTFKERFVSPGLNA